MKKFEIIKEDESLYLYYDGFKISYINNYFLDTLKSFNIKYLYLAKNGIGNYKLMCEKPILKNQDVVFPINGYYYFVDYKYDDNINRIMDCCDYDTLTLPLPSISNYDKVNVDYNFIDKLFNYPYLSFKKIKINY